MTPVRLEPAALRSRVKHSTTEPLGSLISGVTIVIILSLCTHVSRCYGRNNKVSRKSINHFRDRPHIFFHALIFAGSRGGCLNTGPLGPGKC